MQALLDSVRRAALPGIWSQGVKLSRERAVSLESSNGTEKVLRVKVAGHAVAPTVVLYTEDQEWACDCGEKVDPCPHVVAAAISLGQSRETGSEPMRSQKPSAKLRYRFVRQEHGLALERWVVENGRAEALATSLASLMARGEVPFSPTHDDMKLDIIMSSWRRGQVAETRLAEVLSLLVGSSEVWFESRAVRASGERLAPIARVEDERDGVVLRIERDPSVTEVLSPGLALAGNVLRPLAETQLTGPSLERLPLTRFFSPDELGEVVTEVLPQLEKKLTVEVRTRRLPRTGTAERPRVHMEYAQEGHALTVLPTLVYGSPPRARIDEGKLVHLDGPVPLRDPAAEQNLVHRLRDELNLVFGRRVGFDGKEAVRFLQRLKAWNADVEQGGKRLVRQDALVPSVAVNGDMFDIVFEAVPEDDDMPGDRVEAGAVLRAWQDGLGLVPLEGGGFAPLPHDWLERFGHRVADLLAARQSDGKIATVALPGLGELCDELGAARPPGLAKLAPLLEGFDAIPPAPLPTGLTGTLRPYQRHGVDWLCFLRSADLGAILADDMGLGKTLQMLCAVARPTLVVCPKSVVHNWVDEIRRFRPDLRTFVYHGKDRALDAQADITLTTYAVLRLDVEILAARAWETVVLDEAQTIKNEASQVARAACQLPGKFRVALSGTPVENRLSELWSLFRFTNPGLLGTRADFQERYADPIGAGQASSAERLRTKIRPFLLRRLKRDVAPELPPRSDVVLYCELDEEERNVYDAIRAATRQEVVSKLSEGGNVLAALEALLRLRQAACHPALIPGQHAATSSKLERLIDALTEATADGHKSLVFSQWTSLLDLIEPHLAGAGIAHTRLDGSTRDRAGVVADFQGPSGPPVMLASLKAGGTGLNLTAADHVFLLDPWWNPAAEDQAADRAHRIGQDRPVMVYRLVAKDTVEEGILALQTKKRLVADVALGGADQAAGLTRDDLLALLQ
jgi:superfamily II DNA or RNA helicase